MEEILILLGVCVAFYVGLRLVFVGVTKGRPQDWTSSGTIDYDKFNRDIDRLDRRVDEAGSRRRSPRTVKPAAHRPTSSFASAQKLVKGIAFYNPVVVFMDGKADATTDETTKVLIDLLATLEIPFKDVDVPADPEMHLGLPQGSKGTDLPYLYMAGLPVGGADTVLEMAQSGALAAFLKKHDIKHDADVAQALVQSPK